MLAMLCPGLGAQQPAPAGGPQDHVAALKQSLGQGQAMLRQYEWIETTVINFKGEEKSRKQNRCYYGRGRQGPEDATRAGAGSRGAGGRAAAAAGGRGG